MENIPYPGHKCYGWHKSFLEGQEQVEDDPRAGRPSTSKTYDNVQRVRSLVRSYRRLTLRMISSELNLNRFTVHQILTQDLDMRKVCAKLVPKNLTTEQKANRRDVCLDLLDRLEKGPEFFTRVITGDESWIRPRDKTPKSGVAHCKLSPSQESENEQIQNQVDAHLFFWQSGDRPQGICATRTNCQSNFFYREGPWKTQEKGGTCATRHCTHLDAAPWQRPVTRQSPSMNFWQKKAFLLFLSPLFAGSQSLWLLFIERTPFWYFG